MRSIMSPSLKLILNASAQQFEQLRRLQTEFSAACNAIAPIAQANRCWNRVALHHLAYRELRTRFPQLGSQMACNAIYSVARTYRAVLQHKQSPWNIEARPNLPLPLICFTDKAPVYFDRHTLSLKNGMLSMYTLDGRMRFELNLADADARRFGSEKIREIVLLCVGNHFVLQVWLDEKSALPESENHAELPEYLLITPPNAVSAAAPATAIPMTV